MSKHDRPQPKPPSYHGPTSSIFNLDLARSGLQMIGITQPEDQSGEISDDVTPFRSARHNSPLHRSQQLLSGNKLPSKDPLWLICREEANRLSRVYEEEMGVLHPLIDVEELTRQISRLYDLMEAATRAGPAAQQLLEHVKLDNEDCSLLKAVLATALMIEGSGQSEVGQKLFRSIQPVVERQLWNSINIRGLQLLSVVVSPHSTHMNRGKNLLSIFFPRPCISSTEPKKNKLGV